MSVANKIIENATTVGSEVQSQQSPMNTIHHEEKYNMHFMINTQSVSYAPGSTVSFTINSSNIVGEVYHYMEIPAITSSDVMVSKSFGLLAIKNIKVFIGGVQIIDMNDYALDRWLMNHAETKEKLQKYLEIAGEESSGVTTTSRVGSIPLPTPWNAPENVNNGKAWLDMSMLMNNQIQFQIEYAPMTAYLSGFGYNTIATTFKTNVNVSIRMTEKMLKYEKDKVKSFYNKSKHYTYHFFDYVKLSKSIDDAANGVESQISLAQPQTNTNIIGMQFTIVDRSKEVSNQTTYSYPNRLLTINLSNFKLDASGSTIYEGEKNGFKLLDLKRGYKSGEFETVDAFGSLAVAPYMVTTEKRYSYYIPFTHVNQFTTGNRLQNVKMPNNMILRITPSNIVGGPKDLDLEYSFIYLNKMIIKNGGVHKMTEDLEK
jgi:hypothetical protein